MTDEPKLLRIPRTFHSVADVLATAAQLDLPNVLVLCENENGSLTLLDSGLTCAEANWLLDRAKSAVMGETPFYVDKVKPAS